MKKSMTQSLSHFCLAAGMTLSLAACVNIPYKAPIQQGNVVEADRIGMVREGMTKVEVANTIGSPILQDIFHADRWDYIYRLDKHYQKPDQRRITIWFNKGVAAKIERDLPVETTTPVAKPASK
ncbi:outer membrane protein assembly factor BamE [Hydromonas duriensis]|nr:outer membrane protein assembly factor BamE [Hydromonas duriensis]